MALKRSINLAVLFPIFLISIGCSGIYDIIPGEYLLRHIKKEDVKGIGIYFNIMNKQLEDSVILIKGEKSKLLFPLVKELIDTALMHTNDVEGVRKPSSKEDFGVSFIGGKKNSITTSNVKSVVLFFNDKKKEKGLDWGLWSIEINIQDDSRYEQYDSGNEKFQNISFFGATIPIHKVFKESIYFEPKNVDLILHKIVSESKKMQ